MEQQIKIGVGADASAGEQAIKGLGKAADTVAAGVQRVATETRALTRDLYAAEAAARRLGQTQAILTREFGRHVSQEDASVFLGNFERMRAGRGLGSRRLRAFNDFDQWYHGHAASFATQTAAAHHRRFVMASAMQGTQHNAAHGAPPLTPAAGGGGRGGGAAPPPGFGAGITPRAASSALGFVKGGLALAGIGGLMGMAGKGLADAYSEAVGTDTLKRQMGDLGVDFMALRTAARGAADGLGVTFSESNRLAQQYSKVAGNLKNASDAGLARGGIGFARAFGIDPSEGVKFFADMRRLGVAGDEAGQKRLAVNIAEAIARGGYTGKVDEIIAAVSEFASLAARMTLSAPNVGAYAGAFSSLSGSGRPGLDPAGAASILGAADNALRAGGGMGEAGMNFVYAALRGVTPDPLKAKALWSAGLFGTTRGVFGPGSIAGDWYGPGAAPLDDVTNFERIRNQIMTRIDPRYRAEVAQNLFQQATPQNAMALLGMTSDQLGAARGLIARAGISPTASSVADIGRIAGAGTIDELRKVYEGVSARRDVSGAERTRMQAALDSGSIDQLKTVLVQVVGTKEQEQTEGDKTRQSITDLTNATTQVGAALLQPTNSIRDAMIALAQHLSPREYDAVTRKSRDAALALRPGEDGYVDWQARARSNNVPGSIVTGEMTRARNQYLALKRAANGGRVNPDDVAPLPPSGWETGGPTAKWNHDLAMAKRQLVIDLERGPAAALATVANEAAWGRLKITSARETAGMAFFRGRGRSAYAVAGIMGNLSAESGLNPLAIGDGGKARGIAQWHPDRWARFVKWCSEQRPPLNPDSLEAQMAYVDYELRTHYPDVSRRLDQATSAAEAARIVGQGYEIPKIWGSRTDEALRFMSMTPIPGGGGGVSGPGGNFNLNIGAPAEILLRDAETRQQRGTVVLKPHVQPAPTGVH